MSSTLLPRLRRSATAALVIGLIAGAASVGPMARPAHAATFTRTVLSTFDQNLLDHINQARVSRGMGRLIVVPGTTDVAHGWSCHLAGIRALAHNGRLGAQLDTHGSSHWTMYAENVAYQPKGWTAGQMFRAYMHSPGHRANILSRSARYVGLWSKSSGGYRFNTIDFVGSTSRAYSDSYGVQRKTC